MLRGLLLLCLSLPLGAFADEALERLERMASAASGLNYSGTFVYLSEGRLQGMRILHDVDAEGHERERLYALTGEPRELIRVDEALSHSEPRNARVSAMGVAHMPIAVPRSLERFADYYRVQLGERDRVAGLEAVQLRILPRDQERYSRAYWVAADSGLLLRAELHDEDGRVVEQMMFSDLQVSPEPLADSHFQHRHTAGVSVSRQLHSAAPAASAWQVAALPAGFTLEALHPRGANTKSGRIEHRVYGDGLARVSVFIEVDEAPDGWQGGSRVGALNAYVSRRDGYRIVVLGEVPATVVRRIAESVRRAPS